MSVTALPSLKKASVGKPALATTFTFVEFSNLRFVIMDCPTESNLLFYLKELLARGVTDVVRVCEPTYDKQILYDNGIQVHDWPFKDGGIPPQETLSMFLNLCTSRFGPLKTGPLESTGPVMAVHCVAGLGRAPVLVAIALIESGMTPLDAVDFIRKRRRGAFNSVQLQYLVDAYKKRHSGSWKMGEAARAFFGRRPSPPPAAMTRSESASSDRSEGSTSSFRESLSRVFSGKSTKKVGSPVLEPHSLVLS